METMESEQFFLKWNNFENNLTSGFADLLQQEAMVDVTLAAEGKIIQAHKVILSICSSYFRNMFQLNPCQHPIVVLKDVGYQELTDMLDFMYKGEANVRQEDLPSFLKLAETLKVKGLAGSPPESENDNIKKNSESQIPNLGKYSLSNERDEPSSDAADEDVALRKKRKRAISPYKNSTVKPLPYSQNIKLEIDQCDDNYVENSIVKVEDNINTQGERLSENSLYSNEYSNARNEKDAGPSNLEENYEAMPQAEISKTREFSFIESCFGGQLLVLQGYCYRKRSSKNDKSYWFCVKAGCFAKGILQPNGYFWIRHQEHNHKPDVEEIDKRQKLLQLKKLAIETNISGQDLLNSLNIKKDVKKYLGFIRTWRYRLKRKEVSQVKISKHDSVDLEYQMQASRVTSKEILVHAGYRYRQDSTGGEGLGCKYWRCNVKTCKARAKIDQNGRLTLSKSEHSHSPHELRQSDRTVVKPERPESKMGDSGTGEKQDGRSGEKWQVLSKKKVPGKTFTCLITDSEGCNIEKLMAETLNENFQVNTEFPSSL